MVVFLFKTIMKDYPIRFNVRTDPDKDLIKYLVRDIQNISKGEGFKTEYPSCYSSSRKIRVRQGDFIIINIDMLFYDKGFGFEGDRGGGHMDNPADKNDCSIPLLNETGYP